MSKLQRYFHEKFRQNCSFELTENVNKTSKLQRYFHKKIRQNCSFDFTQKKSGKLRYITTSIFRKNVGKIH